MADDVTPMGEHFQTGGRSAATITHDKLSRCVADEWEDIGIGQNGAAVNGRLT